MLHKYRKKPNPTHSDGQMLPVMSVMFLLIPALLLAMEVASMAAVAVSPPQWGPGRQPQPSLTPADLGLEVLIAHDGFFVSTARQQIAAEAGRERDSGQPTLGLLRAPANAEDFDHYDYAGLSELARKYELAHPQVSRVEITAQGDIPLQIVVSTLDALRGPDCSSKFEPGENTCLFDQPIIRR